MYLPKWTLLLLAGGSLFFFSRCTTPSPSASPANSSCLTAKDTIRTALVDSLEANIATLGVDSLDRLIERFSASSPPIPLPLAYAKYRRGVQEHYAKNHEGASEWYEQALATYLTCSDADPGRVAMLYKNLSHKYFEYQLDYPTSYRKAVQGIEYIQSLSSTEKLSDLYYELYLLAGKNKAKLGDPQLAINYFNLAHSQLDSVPISYYLQSQMANEKAMVFWQLNSLDSAVHYSDLAKEIILEQPSLVFADTFDLADVYNNAYIIYAARQEENSAYEALQKSIGFNRHLGEKFPLAGNLNNLGVYYKQYDQIGKARAAFLEAQELYRSLNYNFGLAQTADNLGDCYRTEEKFQQALGKYDQAIRLFSGEKSSLEPQSIAGAKYRMGLYEPLVSKARILVKLSQGDQLTTNSQLWQAYAQVDSLLQSLRFDLSDEHSKISTQTKIKPVYEELIALCYNSWQESGDPTWLNRVITYFERSKNFILQEAVVQDRALVKLLTAADYQRKIELEQRVIYDYQKSQNGTLTVSERQHFNDLRLTTELELQRFRDALAQTYPQYRSFLPLQGIPDQAKLQAQLKENEQLIDFFVGEHATYCLSVTKDGADFFRIPLSKIELTEQVQAFRENLEAPLNAANGSIKEQDQLLRSNGYGLYQQLLATALQPDQSKRLILFPDDVLAYLPFEALLRTPVADDRAEYYHDYPFLIKDYTVNYQFSLGLWYNGQEESVPTTASGILAIVPAQASRFEVLLANTNTISLPALGYNQQEIAKLEALGRVDVLAGKGARKSAFLEKAPQYAILHFAGHGNADPSNAYRSFLAFDLENSISQNDELILLPELYTLNIPAEMAVLSACQTADGQLSVGEGVLSLSRAVTLAGARSVVSSLWLVNQESKVGFFGAFYTQLADGETKDAALRSAKLSYLQDANSPWSHPYHWAGMVLVGNARALGREIL